jgi:hypothetical protein
VVVLACDEVKDSCGGVPAPGRCGGVTGRVEREFIPVYGSSQSLSDDDIDVNVRNAVTDSGPYIGNLKMHRPGRVKRTKECASFRRS